ncbi:hypothetical protein K0651_01800 [Ornithinimicrobium sp. Arc0846-15]|nr:hypothetical protein [Ornithinimicrobium laminariae]
MALSPSSEPWLLWSVFFVLPLLLAVGSGIRWYLERSDKTRAKAAPAKQEITQGQTIPFDAVTHFQDRATGCEIDRRILRDYLLRAGEDPDKIIKAGRQNLA